MRKAFLWTALATGVGVSLVVSYQLASQTVVFGSREGNWFYRYVSGFNPRSIEAFAICATLSSALLSYSWRSTAEWRLVLAWCVLATALQALLRSLTPFSFHDIFVNDSANSFLSVALKYDGATMLREFESLRHGWTLHAQSNLPGKLLFVRMLIHFSTDPGTLAWFVVAISNAGGALMYLFVRDLFENKRIALIALILYLFVPGKLFFFPLLNTVTPVIVLACACLLIRWLAGGGATYAALLGASTYALALFEPGALVVGLLFAVLIVRAVATQRMRLDVLVRQLAIGAVAFSATYALFAVWFGFDLAAAMRSVGRDAAAFNVQAVRPYGIWINQNLVDFAFAAGICQSLLALATLASRNRTAALVSLSLVATLVAVDLIGVNRGEVARLWIFLGCLFQIPAACLADELDALSAAALLVSATLLQDALGCAMVGFIVPG